MQLTCNECYDSPSGEYGGSPSDEKHLRVRGTWLKSQAYAMAMAWINTNAPVVRNRLYPQAVTVTPIAGTAAWDIKVRYGPKAPASQRPPQYKFSTTGGTEKITQSLETVYSGICPQFGSADTTAPQFGGGIGYNDGAFDGAEVKRPRFSWSETHVLPFNFVTRDYVQLLLEFTGSVSNTPFGGFSANTVIFNGISDGGTIDDTDENGDVVQYWQLTYSFEAMPNAQGVSIGGSEPFAKNAWDYLWVLRYKKEDSTTQKTVWFPAAVYVERVYEYADFNALMLPDFWA